MRLITVSRCCCYRFWCFVFIFKEEDVEMRTISSSFDMAKLLIREQHMKPLRRLFSSSHMLMPTLIHRIAWIWYSQDTTPLPIFVCILISGNYNANKTLLVSACISHSSRIFENYHHFWHKIHHQHQLERLSLTSNESNEV